MHCSSRARLRDPNLDLADIQFPIVYIPVINDKVFLIGSLGWEWGIVVSLDLGPYLIT